MISKNVKGILRSILKISDSRTDFKYKLHNSNLKFQNPKPSEHQHDTTNGKFTADLICNIADKM